MAPSTPTKRPSHQRKRRTRASVVSDDRRKRQDSKATPKKNKKKNPNATQQHQPHPIAVITQDESPSASTITATPPTSVAVANTSSSNKGMEAILLRNAAVGATKPVQIGDKNILGWFRDDVKSPGKGNSDSIRRSAKNLFEVVHYSNKGKKKKGATSTGSKRLSNQSVASTPVMHVQEHIPVTGISPLRRLFLEDICILPVDDGMICVLCVSSDSPFYPFNQALRNRVDASDRLPMFYRRDTAFVQMRVKVVNNRNRGLFETSKTEGGAGVDRSLFYHLMLDHGNAQIGLEYLGVVDECRFVNIKDFFLYPESFQLWACLSYRRDFRDAFEDKKNKGNRLELLRRLALEANGDVATTLDICSAYDAVTPRASQQPKPPPEVPPLDVLKTLPLAFYNDEINTFSKWTNDLIGESIKRCYGCFISWTSSLLSEECLDELQKKAYEVCGVQIGTIIAALGYNPKIGESRNSHRVKTYERVAMYLFFSVARVRNNSLFTMWSLIGAAVFYGATRRASARYASVLFGHACHSSTLLRLTKPFREADAFWKRVNETLASQVITIEVELGTRTYRVTIYTFDNAQKNYAFKFQRGGKTSNFVKVTARMFIELWQGPWGRFIFKGNPHVIITYVDQAIPSPVGMKMKYESVSVTSASDVLAIITGNPSVDAFEAAQAKQGKPWTEFTQPDFTGKRVSAYFRFVQIASNLRCLYKHLSLDKPYMFQPAECATNAFRLSVSSLLSSLRDQKQFLFRASSFQRRSVLAYRGLRPKAHFLPMPVLREDETKKQDMGGVVTKSLFRCGNLVVNPHKDLRDEPTFVAPIDIEEMWSLIICDGLSYERWRAYLKEIMDLQENMTYVKHYRQCREILKAAAQTVLCPGDLHLTLFHTLSPIYKIFYGGLIQPIKVALGMKRIDWEHVEKCFEQSSLLVLLLVGRSEPRLMELFVCEIGDDNPVDPESLQGAQVAHQIAVGFDGWLDVKIATSKDAWFRVICHFTKMARHFRLFKESLRNGCALTIEYLLLQFQYVFAAMGKPKCLESALSMTEEWYGRMPYWMLQVIRDNRTAKLYDGRRRDGMETAERPNDEMIELNNAAFTSMDFPPSTKAWETHSKNVSLVKQAAMFVETQYRRKQNVDAQDDYNAGVVDGDGYDTRNKKKGSTAPSGSDKKKLIDEMLTLSGVLVETPGRELNPNQLWGIIGDITTELLKEEDEPAASAGEEEMLSNIYSEMQEVRLATTGDGQVEDEECDGINIVPDADAEDEAQLQEDANENDETEEEQGGGDEEVEVGKKRKKQKVAKIPMSKFVDVDMYVVGYDKMKKQDLPTMRRRRNLRETRERQALHDNLFDFQRNMGSNFETVVNRLKKAMREEEVPGRGERFVVGRRLKEASA